MQANTHTHTHAHKYACTHTGIRTYTCTLTQAHTYTHKKCTSVVVFSLSVIQASMYNHVKSHNIIHHTPDTMLTTRYGMPSDWVKFSALAIISSNISHDLFSVGAVIQNCSTYTKPESFCYHNVWSDIMPCTFPRPIGGGGGLCLKKSTTPKTKPWHTDDNLSSWESWVLWVSLC